MKKINLVILSLCLGIISLFGNINIVYAENDIDLVGEEVSVRGIDEGTFQVLSIDGEKTRLFAHFNLKKCGYSYNSTSDGNVPVEFKNSMLYQGLQDNTSTWKSDIENNDGKTNIYLVDAPTLDEVLSIGNFVKIASEKGAFATFEYKATDLIPDWLYDYGFITKTINGNGVYYLYTVLDSYSTETKFYIALADNPKNNAYGSCLRPVLETSIYNLSSDNEEIQSYLNSVRAEMDAKDNQSNDNASNDDKAQVVKVPSTGIDAPIVFTGVGLAVLVIAGIIIWVIVKDKRAKK